jgi:glyoxylase-like metal-dependent hydrolase (beta-lactamase superfamily II)
MRASLVLALALIVSSSPTSAAPGAAPPAARGVFELELTTIAPGIHLLQRPDHFRQPVEPNLLVIENEADLVVVDSGGTPATAESAIRLIRGITPKPVSVLVDTHWHGDHHLGNAVFRREYPGLRVLAHRNTHRDATGKPMAYVERYPKAIAEYAAALTAMLEHDSADGQPGGPPLAPDRRARVAQGLEDARAYGAEMARVEVSPPDWSMQDEVVLTRGARTISVRYLGRGNTEGDLVVWLPAERILASGDLVVAPIPYGFGSFPAQWIETLDRLAAYDFALLVPGHGPLMRDRSHVRLVQAMLREVRAQAARAVAAGQDLAAFKGSLDLSAHEPAIVGDDQRRRTLFQAWWKDPIARSAWLEARGEPIVQGASDETG